jgi:hypothetical protein
MQAGGLVGVRILAIWARVAVTSDAKGALRTPFAASMLVVNAVSIRTNYARQSIRIIRLFTD